MDELSPTALALAALPDGVMLFDRRQRVSFLNRAAAALLAADVDQLRGASWDEVRGWLALPEPVPLQRHLAVRMGNRFYVQGIALPPEAARAGLSRGLLLTRSAEPEQQLRDVAAMLSHEARVPLTVIRGYADLLLRELAGPLNADQREFVEVMRDRCADLVHLANQTIAFTDVLTWSRELPRGEVDVVAVVHEVANRVRVRHHARAIRCEVSPAGGTQLATTGEGLLMHALLQLADNACNATPDGGAISLNVRRDGDRVLIAIRDGGPGAPEAYGRDALDIAHWLPSRPYEQTRYGPWLGLLIVRACLEHGNFTATISSAEGAGSTVVVSVPAG